MEITIRFDEKQRSEMEIIDAVQKNIEKIANDIGNQIAGGIESIWENQPIASSHTDTDKEKAPTAATTEAKKTKPPYIEESCRTKHFETVVACIHGHLVYLNITTQKLPKDTTAVFEDFPTVDAFLGRTAKRFRNVDFFHDGNQ